MEGWLSASLTVGLKPISGFSALKRQAIHVLVICAYVTPICQVRQQFFRKLLDNSNLSNNLYPLTFLQRWESVHLHIFWIKYF